MSSLKINNVSFLILTRIDSVERIENILSVSNYLKEISNKIILFECATFNNGILQKLICKKVQYKFFEDNDPILHRTKYINKMVHTINTPYIAVWDTDVIVPIDQIMQSVTLLQNGEADFVYPYEKRFLDTSPILRKFFLQEGNIQILERNATKMKEMYNPDPVGGAFMVNTRAYIESGMENEDFYGWGMEDGERFYRWENMGYRIKRVPGPLFHLSHGRGINSVFHNSDQGFYKRKEVLSVRRNKNVDGPQLTDKQVPFQKINL